jgi:hypothetical protein
MSGAKMYSCSPRSSCDLRVAEEHDLAAAVRQARGGVLEGHRPCQPQAFLHGDVRGHAHTADGRSLGDIVDNQHRLQAD